MVAKVGNFLFIGGVRGISGFFFRSLGEKLFLCLGRSPMVVIFFCGGGGFGMPPAWGVLLVGWLELVGKLMWWAGAGGLGIWSRVLIFCCRGVGAGPG